MSTCATPLADGLVLDWWTGELGATCADLERSHGDVLDIEFTVERSVLYFLQVRGAKRTPEAAVRIAAAQVRSHHAGNVLGEHTPLAGLVDDGMPTPTEMAATAAYAEAGQFDRAIAACESALGMKPDAALAAAIRRREVLYRRHEPYRSP